MQDGSNRSNTSVQTCLIFSDGSVAQFVGTEKRLSHGSDGMLINMMPRRLCLNSDLIE